VTRQVTRLPTSRGSEQTSSELQTHPLLAKGTNMSEQKQSFMVELDMWSSENVVSPLYLACMRGPEEAIVEAKN
jgi:hypothetical protein